MNFHLTYESEQNVDSLIPFAKKYKISIKRTQTVSK